MVHTDKSPQIKEYSSLYLAIVVAVAFLLRVLFLGSIPNGFFCDEASNGYDSYALLHTLRDQYGEFLPLFARAFDDYRPSLYIFLSIPFIKLFGLTEFATRLPAALIGTLTVLILYYLAKQLFNQTVGLFAALLLAISPWHLQFSRIAFEAILLPVLFCLGLLFFLKSFKQPNYLLLSAIVFGLSLHTYQSARVFVPLFLIGLILIYRHQLWHIKKQVVLSSILFLLIFVPLFSFWITPEGMARATSARVTFDPITLLTNYLSYFDPKFLFIIGDPNKRHSPERLAELHFFEIITVLIGFIYLLREHKEEKWILLLWLLLYPIPSALTAPSQALRALVGVPVFAIISAYGIFSIFRRLSNRPKWFFSISTFLLALSLTILITSYFINYPKSAGEDWEYGMKQAIQYAEKSNYSCITVSNKIYLKKCGGIQVFIPFYSQYPPADYQRSPISPTLRRQLFLGEGSHTIGKYTVTSISPNILAVSEPCLFIIPPNELQTITAQRYQWREVNSIKDPRGIERLKLIEVQPS
jgi:4-amino-4-deoxy-L-arabinose transferase-like glycosyltransferase